MTSPPSKEQGQGIRLYLGGPHPCSYLPDRTARTLFVDPHLEKDTRLHGHLQNLGFRRSGDELYRPDCGACKACVPIRIPASRFEPRRIQRRIWRRNAADTRLTWVPAQLTDEYFDLYYRYIQTRHPDGGMSDPEPDDFERFLTSHWSETHFLEIRIKGRLMSVAVTDPLPQGLSAVYTFFDPEFDDRSPGVFSVLCQIAETRRIGLPWLFLGYWVAGCRKMHYKAEYRPVQLLIDGQWTEFGPGRELMPPGTAA